MDNEDYGYEYNEGSDIDNWEDEQVFQDHEGQEDEDECIADLQGFWGIRGGPQGFWGIRGGPS